MLILKKFIIIRFFFKKKYKNHKKSPPPASAPCTPILTSSLYQVRKKMLILVNSKKQNLPHGIILMTILLYPWLCVGESKCISVCIDVSVYIQARGGVGWIEVICWIEHTINNKFNFDIY